MKKHGILNSHIAKLLADLGHTDTVVIADASAITTEGSAAVRTKAIRAAGESGSIGT